MDDEVAKQILEELKKLNINIESLIDTVRSK